MIRTWPILRSVSAFSAAATMGCASTSTVRLDAPSSNVCGVLTAFMAGAAQDPARFPGMPAAVVWPKMGASAPSLLEPWPDGPEDVRRQIAEFNARASISIEERVENDRAAVRARFEHLRDVPAFDDELGESYVSAYGPAQSISCDWPKGVEQLAENEDPNSDTGSRWRRVRRQVVYEPIVYSFGGVGISRDGRRALLDYSYSILNGGWGWGSPRGPEGLIYGGHGGSAFAVLERLDDSWRVVGHGAEVFYN